VTVNMTLFTMLRRAIRFIRLASILFQW
jgi:hypothetical protein